MSFKDVTHDIAYPKQSMYDLFTYMKTMKINHSWIGKYTIPMDDNMDDIAA